MNNQSPSCLKELILRADNRKNELLKPCGILNSSFAWEVALLKKADEIVIFMAVTKSRRISFQSETFEFNLKRNEYMNMHPTTINKACNDLDILLLSALEMFMETDAECTDWSTDIHIHIYSLVLV